MISDAAIIRTRLKCREPSSLAGRCETSAAIVQLSAAPSAKRTDPSLKRTIRSRWRQV